jgi:hypothetical protein
MKGKQLENNIKWNNREIDEVPRRSTTDLREMQPLLMVMMSTNRKKPIGRILPVAYTSLGTQKECMPLIHVKCIHDLCSLLSHILSYLILLETWTCFLLIPEIF